jgi:hypothetical protein
MDLARKAGDKPEVQKEEACAGSLNEKADLRGSDRKQMQRGHEENPQRIRKALDAFAPRVPDESKPLSEIPGIPHRDHLIVLEAEVAFAIHDKAGLEYEKGIVDGC